MYIAMDILTQEAVGPFETENEAIAFADAASDELGEEGMVFHIHQLFEPIEWDLNNNCEPTVDEVITSDELPVLEEVHSG